MVVAWIEYCKLQGRKYGDNLYLNFRDMLEHYGKNFNPLTNLISTSKNR